MKTLICIFYCVGQGLEPGASSLRFTVVRMIVRTNKWWVLWHLHSPVFSHILVVPSQKLWISFYSLSNIILEYGLFFFFFNCKNWSNNVPIDTVSSLAIIVKNIAVLKPGLHAPQTEGKCDRDISFTFFQN